MYMFFSQYEYDLYSIASLIVSANRLAMCTCTIIAVLIYHDVIYPPRSTVLFAILNRLSTGRITQYCL